LLIADEPTSALDVTVQLDVLNILDKLVAERGMGLIFISHDLRLVSSFCDRVIVMYDGKVVEQLKASELRDARHPYTRELLAAFEPKPRQGQADADAGTKQLLRIDNVTAGYGAMRADGLPLIRAVDSVSLVVEKGRNLGVIGESGCGKSTLARVIAGIHPAAAGDIVFDGKDLQRAARKRSQDQLREMQIVFQYADTALNPAKPVEDIIARPLAFYHRLDRQARSRRVDE
ncbi:MAG: ABC transporter ATP-binding protein, partial [Mesorhizobium sp.]